ncbi:MAG: TRAP transporter small permease [Spirochaetaceae bacterium]|jgi:TRAP-type C4-dicarboxylate transport system permease small subunit|nr:TRAP transporter small permease [Spirochaetaceae bacterium]
MKVLKMIYGVFCKTEEFLVSLFIAVITFLVFISAIARGLSHPLNWATDVSLLLFAWLVFFGADSALRKADFVRVDMLVIRLPEKVQKFLYYFMYVLSIGFLCVMIRFGIPLSIENSKRLFQTLGISYSWATISAPVGSILLIITIIIKLVSRWKDKKIVVESKEAI